MSAPLSSGSGRREPNAITIGTRRLPNRRTVARIGAPPPRRIPHEFYPTPPAAVRALLSVERFEGSIWEPACGDGAIATVLTRSGYDVVSTDFVDHGFGTPGIDFLRETRPRARNIVTNPPYGSGLADAFLVKALELTAMTGGKTAMLFNLASLCHPRRTPLWRQYPPARLYAIDGVVCWPENRYGPPPEAFRRHRYCWAIWSPDEQTETRFGWLSAAEHAA